MHGFKNWTFRNAGQNWSEVEAKGNPYHNSEAATDKSSAVFFKLTQTRLGFF
jgi:hypothetical protein